MRKPGTRPTLDDLSEEVAEKISLWASLVDSGDEMCGLWLHSAPREGSSYAALAAVRELRHVERYQGGSFFAMTAYHAYTDLRSLWDADKSDAPSFAEWASLDAEVHSNWSHNVLILDDWDDTVPTDFFMKHFYPRLRDRLKAQKPTIIATRHDPSVTGVEAPFFFDLFVVAEVDRSHAGR